MICRVCKGSKTNPLNKDEPCNGCLGAGEVIVKRGDNVGSVKAMIGAVNSVSEMEAYEQLGPLTRAVITDGPIKFLAYPIVADVRAFEAEQRKKMPEEIRHKFTLNLMDPQLDARLAHGLLQNHMQAMSDRDPQDAKAGLVPLRGKPSPKSMREQRRSQRVRFG